jgi:hypothetical protein
MALPLPDAELKLKSVLLCRSRLRRQHVVDRATVAHDISMRQDELFERGLDVVEVDVGGEAIDACLDAGWLLPMHIGFRGNDIGQNLQIRDAPRVGFRMRTAVRLIQVLPWQLEDC